MLSMCWWIFRVQVSRWYLAQTMAHLKRAIRIGIKRFFLWYQFLEPLWFVGRYFQPQTHRLTWPLPQSFCLEGLAQLALAQPCDFFQLRSLLEVWRRRGLPMERISSTDSFVVCKVPPILSLVCQTSCFFEEWFGHFKIVGKIRTWYTHCSSSPFSWVEGRWDFKRRFSPKSLTARERRFRLPHQGSN